MIRKVAVALVFVFVGLLIWNINGVYAGRCGNGEKEYPEECDDGSNNSDSRPDGCRVNCMLHYCGDGVTDSDEECDEGKFENSNEIPGRCRKNCKTAKCGDGFLDFTEGEVCDDGNNDGSDGCHNCYPCYLPEDDLVLSAPSGETLELCYGSYELTDEGEEGIIIINDSGVTLDCKGATLIGAPKYMQNISQSTAAPAAASALKQNVKNNATRFDRSRKTQSSGSNQSSSGSNQGNSGGSSSESPRNPTSYQGTGIVVNGSDVVVMNCNIEGFKQGIKFNSTGGVLLNSNVCDNLSSDITSGNNQNYGVKNSCSKCENWQENGQSSCSSSCN